MITNISRAEKKEVNFYYVRNSLKKRNEFNHFHGIHRAVLPFSFINFKFFDLNKSIASKVIMRDNGYNCLESKEDFVFCLQVIILEMIKMQSQD